MNLSQDEVRRRINAAMNPRLPAVAQPSLSLALSKMLSEGGLQRDDGAEGATAGRAADNAGQPHDPHRIFWPLESFPAGPTTMAARALNAGTMGAGGALVAKEMIYPLDPLRPWSVVLQGGATVLPGLRGDVPVPRFNSDPVAYWLNSETQVITESTPALGDGVLKPKQVACYVEVSRRLLHQALAKDQFERVLSSALLRAVGKRLDSAVFVGTGTGGEPAGLTATSGVGAAPGAGLTWDGVVGLRQAAVDIIGSDLGISWIGGAGAQSVLSKRLRFSGSGKPIWDDYTIGGVPAFASSAVPSSTIAVGDWSQVYIGLWGDAVQIEMNPFANFASGVVGFRVILTCDVHIAAPAYFSVAQGIS